jgi:hypothetical protein
MIIKSLINYITKLMNNKLSFPLLVIVIVASSYLTSLISVSILSGGGFEGAGGSYAIGYATAMNDARNKLAQSGLFPAISEIKNISGTVKSIGNNQFVMTVGRISPNPLDPQGPSERTIKITDQTKITKQVPLTSDEQAAAMKIFQDNMKANKPTSPPPSYNNEPATLSDIAVGMTVTVTAASDIKLATTIVAMTIDFAKQPTGAPTTVSGTNAPTEPANLIPSESPTVPVPVMNAPTVPVNLTPSTPPTMPLPVTNVPTVPVNLIPSTPPTK